MTISGEAINRCMACILLIAGMHPAIGADVADLADLPKSKRIWMGIEEGAIRPAAFEQFRVDADAVVVLHANGGDMMEAGQHWATLDPEQLEIERETIELEEMKREHQRAKDEYENEQARVALLLEIEEAHRKSEDLEQAAQTAELDASLRKRAREAVEIMSHRISLLEERASLEHQNEQTRLKEIETELQERRAQRQLLAMERRSKLVSRHGGRLRLSDEFHARQEHADDRQKVWMGSGELLGTIVDDSRYEIHVPANTSAMLQLPENEIGVFFQDGQTGTLIPGNFLRIEEVESGLEINRTYVFSVPDERMDAAREAGGQKNFVHIYRMFTNEKHIVHKRDLAFEAPEILQESGWGGLIRHLWPQSRIIQVGPQSIALEVADAD